jgi:1-acyl-sn-glycerol-3-phosphate acyltransferase
MNLYRLLNRPRLRAALGGVYRVRVEGREHLPEAGACIVASNHESVADPFLLALATTREIRYMTKAELFRRRPLAALLRAAGAFPVERGGGDLAALGEAAELLRQGEVVCIFPQGTSRQLAGRRWQRGAARLALATGAPVVPVRLDGTRRLPLGGQTTILVEPARATISAARALTERIERAVLAP